jgi:fermentation-respiration switch protein FrsA (DUF1100 family)
LSIGWIIFCIVVICVSLFALYLFGGAWFIAYIATHPPRKRLRRTPAEFGAAYEDIQFPSRDGLPLSGWYVPARPVEGRSTGVVILCHGMSANREEVLNWAAALYERGLALIMFDFRALGRSGGDRCTFGSEEPNDLLGAVDYVRSRPELADCPIGVFGFSMGGATAILVAADDPRIAAVATHGAFATLQSAITQRCKHHYGETLSPLVEWILRNVGKQFGWYPAGEVTPVTVISRLAPRPLLILHGGRDKIVTPTDARDLIAAAGEPKSLRMLPRSGHARIHRNLRGPVERRVAQFFNTALTRAHRHASSHAPDSGASGGSAPLSSPMG